MKNYFSQLHYKKSIIAFLLLPLSIIYFFIIKIRRWLFQKNILHTKKMSVPIIVVGNITLGGTGKTPVVIYLVELLKQQNFKVGVISRGYGAKASSYPYLVTENSLATEVGDEPLLIYLRTRVPVAVDPMRTRAAEYLIKNNHCNVIISDDGLQHYALSRDIEIAVIDAMRGFGNGFLFPAGPLREPISRLKQVDFVLTNGGNLLENNFRIQTIPNAFINLANPNQQVKAEYFADKNVIAMAGIGNPDRFFKTLADLEIKFLKHPLPDHYGYAQQDLNFAADIKIIMTEKDAVKVRSFATTNMWYLPISIKIDNSFSDNFLDKFGKLCLLIFP